MDRLINAILKLSREGRRALKPERLDAGRADRRLARQRAASARRGRRRASTIEPARCRSIVSDRLALEQIFGNLIDNAVKYLDPAPARPHRRARPRQPAAASSSRSRTMAAASIRRTTSGSSSCSAAPAPRTSPARASASPMSAPWCAGSAATIDCRLGARARLDLPVDAAAPTVPAMNPRRRRMNARRAARHHRHGRGRRGPCPPDREEHPPRRRQQRDRATSPTAPRRSTTCSAPTAGRNERPAAGPARPQPARHDRHRHPGQAQGQRAAARGRRSSC